MATARPSRLTKCNLCLFICDFLSPEMPGPVWAPDFVVLRFFQSGFFECWSQRIRPHLRNSNNNIFGRKLGLRSKILETSGPELLIEHANEERVVGWLFDPRGDEKRKRPASLVRGGPS
jgi:hypothetical protein